jgi:hypothetical protein
MEENGIKLIKELLSQFDENSTVSEKIYHLVKSGLNETRLRNALIIRDYDNMMKSGNILVWQAHCDIASEYNLSIESIKYIIRKRAFNEL